MATVLAVGLAVLALALLAKAGRRLTTMQALGWVVVILLVPIVGPLLWLLVNHKPVREGRSRQEQ
nr:PLDc N-terminal domain-containing protein [Microbacterium protaetiae]